ncbi:MAG: hypothetical protein NTX20_01790 [Verrucomicrobia bacterium]|nr:hypothetical protein [Verrucomicrobiota bacterium]
MELALFIKIAIGVVAFAAWVAGQIKVEAGQPAPIAVLPSVPRRTRRVRNAPPPLAPEPEPLAPVAATHLDDTSLVVTRPARAQSRLQFRGSAALRQAIIAREVLGLPLSLRPPRF